MYRYSPTNNKTLIKAASSLLIANSTNHSHEPLFDPLNYEFDAESIGEPFTYFHNGPTESRRKASEFSSPTITHLSWLPTHHSSSLMSSPDASPQSCYSPTMGEQFNGMVQLKTPQILPQQQQLQSSYPKTICRHCKSHNMPECLYTSHTMYDENGVIFCPVLKKCHCNTCMRVTTNPVTLRDDDSDDDNNTRSPTTANELSHLYGVYPRRNSYRTSTNNNF
ncbi:unnamed protein product [Adineta ricciae]|uniref:Nanos-type domain-containing protein n=1 Tax=Adineta ricciae TaxID=249248 RepID=A0A814ZWE4_ADIRI|nr:unnamed protein product [Adineta ricciae]